MRWSGSGLAESATRQPRVPKRFLRTPHRLDFCLLSDLACSRSACRRIPAQAPCKLSKELSIVAGIAVMSGKWHQCHDYKLAIPDSCKASVGQVSLAIRRQLHAAGASEAEAGTSQKTWNRRPLVLCGTEGTPNPKP